MAAANLPKLFQPTKVGPVMLSHRVVFAPLTRLRSTKSTHVPIVSLMKEYYGQRARVSGTLLITEATFIAPQAGGHDNVPGIWSDDQIDAWKEITDTVHAHGSSIFLQLWALGRVADPSILASYNPPFPLVGPSSIPVSSQTLTPPRPLTTDEITEYTELFAQAAHNAVHRAGFDGVEIHGANGYIVDQFLQDVSNDRTDQYGGSVEGRSKFALEVVDAVSRAVGPERTGLRLSPWSTFQDMGMVDPVPQFTHLVTALRDAHPSLAYLHVVEPRASGPFEREYGAHESNDFVRAIWQERPYISAGGHTPATAVAAAERDSELVAFGRFYISNPDLPLKLKNNRALTPYDRKTFYTPGEREDAHIGYTDYPFERDFEDIPVVRVAA
ncbi:hypothetical protein D9615_007072 [Tricholomella constricta]|uniref:NADH:flavin oxidoreductase/NADH oxidase N-terminal domain-containing protein n=1 Tax=Tricholomella constricta TaxID=117010 RepID=A0A8H5H8T5_9AGAR|nr:hypothetical protein D9615_007072 [Tricholomella constricta]